MAEGQNNLAGEVYEIKLKGHLSDRWSDWFDGMEFTHQIDGTTTLTGEILDQAALHGLLKKVRDLGLPLISVICKNVGQTDESSRIGEKE